MSMFAFFKAFALFSASAFAFSSFSFAIFAAAASAFAFSSTSYAIFAAAASNAGTFALCFQFGLFLALSHTPEFLLV